MESLKDDVPSTSFRRTVSSDPFAPRKNAPLGIDPHALARSAAARIDAIEKEMALDLRGNRGGAKLAPHPQAEQLAARTGFVRVAPPPGVVVAPAARRAAVADNPTQLLDQPFTTMVLGNTSLQELVEVNESKTAPAVERASVMYASGQTREAAQVLLEALSHPGELGVSEFNAYRMLFDLLRYLGTQQLFDKFALDFTRRFDKTPPSWDLPETTKPIALNSTPTVNLGQRLDATVVSALEQLKAISLQSQLIRIDASDIDFMDQVGIELLLRVIKAFTDSTFTLQIYGISALLFQLDQSLGQAANKKQAVFWLFKLELLQISQRQAEYDDTAIDYAAQFEVSPPSFGEGSPRLLDAEQLAAQVTTIMQVERDDHLFLKGEVVGDGQDLIDLIATAFAVESVGDTVICDCYGLHRIEYIAAGRLLTALTAWTTEGKAVQFLNLNHPIASLFVSLGIHHLAIVERRKDN